MMLSVGDGAGYFGVMPGEVGAEEVFGAKLVTLFPDNPSHGIPTVQGYILLFNRADGTPLALVEAASVTALRTAAASAAATRVLAQRRRFDSRGAGLRRAGRVAPRSHARDTPGAGRPRSGAGT